jgi:hypothetical protein
MCRSIVMVDWSLENQPTERYRDEFLWRQMLLSLLYDEVLAQDETLVCSEKMATWFRDSEKFRLLEELFDCGGITILKRPLGRYPSEQLKERASTAPIHARREHLQNFSVNNDGTRIQFDDNHVAFHNRLEALYKTPRNGPPVCRSEETWPELDGGVCRSLCGGTYSPQL